MAIKFNRSQTFATNGTVTAAGLHNLIDGTDIYQALITDQTNLTSVGSGDELLIADADLTANDAPRAVTVNELFEDALTISTYTNANINNISYGTSTGTRLVSTNASITTGTIPTLTAGTTTSTVANIPTLTAGTTTSTAANITNGTIQTLTSSTATITGGTFSGLLNSSTGTFSGAINSTSGTIGTGTITNLSTTLVGDLTISTGSATVGTRVAVVNTAQEYTATHNFNATSLTISTGTVDWDLSANQVAKLEVTTNSTLSTPTNPVDGATYMLVVTQGTAGNNTLSFSTAYKFPGGIAPTLSVGSADVDVLAFVSNGTVLYGVTSQDFS
jgi:hypothetical protein